jgi:hypothetical protein
MNFIGEYFLEDISICDNVIDYFESNENKQHLGAVGQGTFNLEKKDSTDISVHPSEFNEIEIIQKYLIALDKCIDKYVEEYPDCNAYAPWSITEGINVRKYLPNQGFKIWHTERCSAFENIRDRHIVFMTYLNDVTEGGGTKFKNQNKIFQPEKGKTLVWPADWTHTHRGIISETQTKYVVTGWFNYH